MFPLQGLSTKIIIMGPLQRSNNHFIWKTLHMKKSRAQAFLVQGEVGFGASVWGWVSGPSDSAPQLTSSYQQFSLAIVAFDSPPTLCPHISGSLGSINDHLRTFLSSLYIHSNLYQNIHWVLLASRSLPRGFAARTCLAMILSHACPCSPSNAPKNDNIFQNRSLVRTRTADHKFSIPSAPHSLCHVLLPAFPWDAMCQVISASLLLGTNSAASRPTGDQTGLTWRNVTRQKHQGKNKRNIRLISFSHF